jgi:hypothetical protein
LARLRSLDAILDEVLRVLLEHTGAPYGYVEVLNERADPPLPRWRARARSGEHITWIQDVISHGIIGCARIEGRTIATPSAIDDARFANLGSVREHEIGAVMCAPFDGFWTSGVVYLQGSSGWGAEAELVELAARQLGLLAERHRRELAPGLRLEAELDAVKRHAVEEALHRYDWNISAVARELGLGRATIRELIRGRRHR